MFLLLALLACAAYPSLALGTPVAENVAVGTDAGVPVLVTLRASDTADAPLSFAIERDPVHGALGTIESAGCTTSPGTTLCTATVLYTPAAAYAGMDDFAYSASDGSTSSNVAMVTAAITVPQPAMPPPVTVAMGAPYVASVVEVVTGATVDWGDGSPAEILTVNPDRSATLTHVYALEGSFTLTVTNAAGITGTTLVHVLVSGSTATSSDTVGPGDVGTITLPGLTATLDRSPGGDGAATMLGALYPATLPGFFVGGAFGDPLTAFDVRVVAAADADVMTVTFGYPEAAIRSRPILTYLSPQTNTFEPVAGSQRVTPSLTIDPVGRLITVVFDQTSTPTLTALSGTRLVVSDRAVPRVLEVGTPSAKAAGSRVRMRTGLAVACPAHGPPCVIAVRVRAAFSSSAAPLKSPGLVIGKRRMRCAPGKSVDVNFALGARTRSALERLGELPITIAIHARVVGHPTAIVRRTLTVAAP